ncbi:MAG: M20 family metallopeptidase [Bacteroidota bacterium]
MQKEKIKALSAKYLPEVISIRRYIHANPELSFEEYNTSKFVASKLREYGVKTLHTGIAKTGIVAVIEGKGNRNVAAPTAKKIIALRSELDALPIVEKNDIEYKSKNYGVMHACGHDANIASLLGVAKILSELKHEFEGTVKLIFQPGEEKLPGGASLMIKEGVLRTHSRDTISHPDSNMSGDRVSTVFAQHVLPSLDVGKAGFRYGMYMASDDELYITVKGKGGHAAMPQQTINPIEIASHIIIALKEIVPPSYRNISSAGKREISDEVVTQDIPTVLSIGKVIAEGATNVIPDEVKLEGTFRTMNEEWRAQAHEKMIKTAKEIAEKMGGSCEFKIVKGYPFLVNDEETTKRARKYAEEYLGSENVVDMELRMTADDFAYFSQQVPSCYYRIGIRNEARGITSGVHTSTFDIDENAIETGMGLMAWIAVNELKD